MQESLIDKEEKINVEELEQVLQSDIEEVVSLCKKACLKPKTDSMGNAYFTRKDVSVLKKMKELYTQSKDIQESRPQIQSHEAQKTTKINAIKENSLREEEDLISTDKKVNFLMKAKNRIKTQLPTAVSSASVLQNKLEVFEKSLMDKMSALLSEKMDGFDEIIVELIRSKTENENLRQQVNSLNKQLFILKGELASYKPVAFGFYAKCDRNDM